MTLENRTQAMQISLAHPRVTIRRGKQTVQSMLWNGHGAIRSTSPDRVNSKAS
jgi:hypothetical protein